MKYSYLLISIILIGFNLHKPLYSVDRNNSFTKSVDFKIENSANLVIGTKINDSLAQVVLTRQQLETNFLPVIPQLQGLTLSAEPFSIHFKNNLGYFLFTVTDSVNNKVAVAFKLILSGSDLIFPLQNGGEVHILRGKGNCNSCAFIFSEAWITSSSCETRKPNQEKSFRGDCEYSVISSL